MEKYIFAIEMSYNIIRNSLKGLYTINRLESYNAHSLRFPSNLLIKAQKSKRYSSQSTINTVVDNNEPISIKNPFEKEKVMCILCDLNLTPNYKNVRLLSQFQSPYTGRIYGRHITGLCKQKQEQVEKEILKAQGAGLMPTYHKFADFLQDSKLFDPEKPVKSHKY